MICLIVVAIAASLIAMKLDYDRWIRYDQIGYYEELPLAMEGFEKLKELTPNKSLVLCW